MKLISYFIECLIKDEAHSREKENYNSKELVCQFDLAQVKLISSHFHGNSKIDYEFL